MAVAKGAVQAFLNRELDSYTWMKKLKRSEVEAELSLFKLSPKFKTDPWLHQLVCFYIGLCMPKFLFLLGPGGGKTKVVLDLMSYRKREGTLKKGLVFVPRLINIGTWTEHAEEHSDLTYTGIEGTTEEKWEQLCNPTTTLSIINYQGLQLAASTKKKIKGSNKIQLVPDPKKLKILRDIYNFVVPDEIHKCKNKNSLWYKLVSNLTLAADFGYGLTGTPIGRDPEDAWSQFYMIDHGETFGTTLGLFRAAFFLKKNDFWAGTKLEFDPKMQFKFNKVLQHRSIRYEEDECTDIPELLPVPVKLHMTLEQKEHYDRAVDGVIAAQGNLSDIDAPFVRTRMVTSGYIQWKDEYGPHTVRFKSNPKMDALEEIIENFPDDKILVFHDYVETGRVITERLKDLKIGHMWLYGGTKNPVRMVQDFREDPKKRVFVANSESGSTGVDGLQKVCRILVFFESPVSPRTRIQAIKRIHRPGQLYKSYMYDLTVVKSVDVRILEWAAEGKSLSDALVDGKVKGMRSFFY